MDDKFYWFPRVGKFDLDDETALALGMNPNKKWQGRGIRWFGWTIGIGVREK